MKTKKLSKKLGLNKTTISDLGNKEMQSVNGGGSSQWSCETCIIFCNSIDMSCNGGICPC